MIIKYEDLKTFDEIVNKWVEVWLPPLRNIEDGKKELITALTKHIVNKIPIPLLSEEELFKIIEKHFGYASDGEEHEDWIKLAQAIRKLFEGK